MLYGYIVIASLTIILIGYSVGRRIGIKEGQAKAVKHAVIELKLDYYNNKKCPICLYSPADKRYSK